MLNNPIASKIHEVREAGSENSLPEEWLERLESNLNCLEQHRPGILSILLQTEFTGRILPIRTDTNLLSIGARQSDGSYQDLDKKKQNQERLRQMIQDLKNDKREGDPIGLCGIKFGYALHYLTQNPPKLFLDKEKRLFLLEPDPEKVLCCLLIHDYTESSGPIQAKRLQWHIGPDWVSTLREAIRDNHFLKIPDHFIVDDQEGQEMEILRQIHPLALEYAQWCENEKNELEQKYDQHKLDVLIDLFGPTPPRSPRVLFITSRFTTVLQYATRDTAKAFTSLGWKTLTLKEPTPYDFLCGRSIRKAILKHRPDLIFTIDHLRYKTNTIPDNIPFVTWVQDELPHLTCVQAGQEVGRRDFVLTFSSPLFINRYEYPASQIIDMPMMLTTIPKRPAQPPQDGDDLVYVSSQSHDPKTLFKAQNIRVKALPQVHLLMQTISRRLRRVYRNNESFPTKYDLSLLIQKSFREYNASSEINIFREVVEHFWHPLNTTLYRQQALRWVAAEAQKRDLSLSIYGSGWENHPEFSSFARGPVLPGPDLEKLTRRTKINLQLEPYPSFSHNRLLDGLAADGFYLIRDHPTNTWMQKLLNFVHRNLGESPSSVEDARERIDPSQREELESILTESVGYEQDYDPISLVQSWHRSQLLILQDSALPNLKDVSFDSPSTLAMRLDRFLEHPDLRKKIAKRQRQNIIFRLSFKSGIKRAIEEIRRRLILEVESEITKP
ncbi:MAG: hypothetical protein QF752_16410 [Planctomycetota bacterium]|jgi:hypothetical protein|nr:hypothetical protein [Planctomycetota bacterium]